MKNFASQLGGKLGVGLCAAGFLAVFMGWNGAASVDRIASQFPYLISGGLFGLCLIVSGIGLLIIQNQRADRAELQATLRELRQALADAGLATTEQGASTREEFQLPVKRPTPEEYAIAPAPAPAPETEADPEPEAEAEPVVRQASGPRKAKRATKARKAAPRRAPMRAGTTDDE